MAATLLCRAPSPATWRVHQPSTEQAVRVPRLLSSARATARGRRPSERFRTCHLRQPAAQEAAALATPGSWAAAPEAPLHSGPAAGGPSPAGGEGALPVRPIDKSDTLMADPYGSIETVMSSPAVTVTADTTLDRVLELFERFTGLPVVDERGTCVGIISNIDVAKFARTRIGNSLPTAKVVDIMTAPAIVIMHHAPVAYAAGLMLKHKVHRLPVVDKDGAVVGIITRTDVFEPLTEGDSRFLHFLVGERRKKLPIISF